MKKIFIKFKKYRLFIIGGVVLLPFIVLITVYAAFPDSTGGAWNTGYRVDHNVCCNDIDVSIGAVDGDCYKVTNNHDSRDYFVPTMTQAEWEAFESAAPGLDIVINGWIPISTCEELQSIGHSAVNGNPVTALPLDGDYFLTQSFSCVQTESWNWNGSKYEGFDPIGDETNPFEGFFDGRGHEISGLYINRNEEDYVGLFGYDDGMRIMDIGLIDNIIKGRDYVGGFAGARYWSGLANSYATGSVSGNKFVGGIAGYQGNGAQIKNSYATGSVSGNEFVGGLVGYQIYSYIVTSYATGNVSGIGTYTGGLVGHQDYSDISNSYATGNVSSSAGHAIGGLAGGLRNDSLIENSYATGDVNGGTGNVIGGLVGIQYDSLIENSYATGDVDGGTGKYVGGLVGDFNGFPGDSKIINSYAIGSVSSSGLNVGGLVGFSWPGTIIIDSYWNTETSGKNNMCGGDSCSGSATYGKTTAEMNLESTFTAWTFDPTVDADWKLETITGTGEPYPCLSWQDDGSCPGICGHTIIDVDGNSYATIQIGDQCWMKENMRTIKYPDGTAITDGTALTANWLSDLAMYSCPPNAANTASDCAAASTLGMSYQWSAAMDGSTIAGAQGICPNGWHIHTDAEWHILEDYLSTITCNPGRESGTWDCAIAGDKLKTAADCSGSVSCGSSGFEGLLAGVRTRGTTSDVFANRGKYALFWSSSGSSSSAWDHGLGSFFSLISRHSCHKATGFSVRCLKD